ncbi:MAG: D-2-hydroxyacid dehydrogenase [Spirochaetales bacterium]|nr:D-2-hydroxyacid dehydrogenase [Spirochaetales bacterium]
MKITVLDGFTLNPGDLSWEELKALGDVTIFERTPEELTIERGQDSEILITNKTAITADIIKKLPKLKYVGVLATGYNVIDIDATRKAGIVVTNIPAYSTDSVAQMIFAHILEYCNRVQRHSDSVKDGRWERSKDFCFRDYPLIELKGKTLGIIGFGSIGKQTAKIASAFGMKIIATANSPKQPPAGVEDFKYYENYEDLLKEADFVSLSCPLTEKTERIINKKSLSLMKSTAVLINTGRGGLVCETGLAEALNVGQIGGACLDVLSTEPPAPDNPLLSAKNCTITPHIAWATKEARTRCMNIAVENVKRFIEGNPQNVVNN